MKKINMRKITMTGSMIAAIGCIAVAFQNFMPHEALTGHDTRDLFLSGALTEAVEEAEKENSANVVAFNVDTDKAEADLKKNRKATVIELEIDPNVDVENSEPVREPASLMDEKIEISE